MGYLPRSALFLVTESLSLIRSLNSFVLRERKWNWLKRKMKSRDARIKNEVLTPKRENKRRILRVGENGRKDQMTNVKELTSSTFRDKTISPWLKSSSFFMAISSLKFKQTSGGSGGGRGDDGSR
ncbi:hypothetical protein Tco_0788881, partial [Tanacetum coccineum]